VRWTEGRNFRAVLDMMASGALNMKPLVSHKFDFNDAISAYEQLDRSDTLGIVLEYYKDEIDLNKVEVTLPNRSVDYAPNSTVCGFLGGGNYASRILIPAFKKSGAQLDTLVTSGGASAVIQGKKNGFKIASTTSTSIYDSENINTVVIATQHHLHATQVMDALKQGKNVFVEKPLAITKDELLQIRAVYDSNSHRKPRLMVGFNRRFSPHITKLKSLLDAQAGPKIFVLTVNAGAIPMDHWTQNPEIGGGRIIGEGCHFVDLLRFLTKSPIIDFQALKVGKSSGSETTDDKVVINLMFEDGSLGTIHYLANGGKRFPKERLEVFCNDAVIQLDNFKKMRGFGWKGFNKMNLLSQDKGQFQCVRAFVEAIEKGTELPISFDEIYEVSEYSIKIAEFLKKN